MPKLEQPCRIILILHAAVTIWGYIYFIQTEAQFVSPLIPSSLVLQIVRPGLYAGLFTGVLLIISLCFYFFQKRAFTFIISSVAIISYLFIPNFIEIYLSKS